MIKPLKAAKNHVRRNRGKYVAAPALVVGAYAGSRFTLWTQFLSNPEAFDMMYPPKS